MKFFLATLFVILSLVDEKSCKQPIDAVVWNKERKLRWSDFQANPLDSFFISAVSSVKLKMDYKGNSTKIDVQVFCIFSKRESWYRDSTDYLLEHEQGHFNIGEIVARMIRKKFSEIEHAEEKFELKTLDSIFDSYGIKLNELQLLYDKDTDRSRNFDGQRKWNTWINSELENYRQQEIANKVFRIKRKLS